MANKTNKEQLAECTIGKLFRELEDVIGQKSKFFEHMTRSRLEFLKGLRSLLDERIDHYEKKGTQKAGKKMTKIKVE
jgi:hypothetical protein